MAACSVITFSEEWRDRLQSFMRSVFPQYSANYIDYCIKQAKDITPSILVVNNEGEIVGCHLYYCTKAIVNGKVIETQWGHDTFLKEQYRKEGGVDFLLARKRIPSFGLGLTETNAKLRKLMKSVFFRGVYNYYIITPYICFSPIQKLFHINNKIKEEGSISIKSHLFKQVYSSSEMPIVNNGFWYKGYYEIDFVRDADYLDYRFFKCNVHRYIVYASEDSYFVVRESSYKGMPALMLSDFRYNPAKKDSVNVLLKAVLKLARKSHLGIVYFVCGDINVEQFFKNKIHYKTHLDFITSYKISPDASFSLTGGDSDADFLKA